MAEGSPGTEACHDEGLAVGHAELEEDQEVPQQRRVVLESVEGLDCGGGNGEAEGGLGVRGRVRKLGECC